ncbi:MAG: hypothetical protein J5973_09635, partial [Eubacterium sp.]|nr:hypothetical protein [Eubacterium sp.]
IAIVFLIHVLFIFFSLSAGGAEASDDPIAFLSDKKIQSFSCQINRKLRKACLSQNLAELRAEKEGFEPSRRY